jgi:ABC-type transport system involved in Fe-S cluster assembly fused permease/ATPase subunit
MGLVMQEPTLFNYTIKENILYGNAKAKESDIYESAKIANALEFITNNAIEGNYEDSASVLYNAWVQNKNFIVKTIKGGEEQFAENLEKLEHLKKKEEQEGKF